MKSETAPTVLEAFNAYFNQIKNLDAKDATEHTLRPALHNLLTALAQQENPKIKVIPEPKRDESGKGAPDVKFKVGESILGYLENKKTEANLNQTLKSDQIEKYKKLSDNLILTNYLEWIWIKEGKVVQSETLAYGSDIGNHKARLDQDKALKVGKLIGNFLSEAPKGIGKVKDLALALATRCHNLREFLTEELIRQEKEHQQGRLFGLFNVFKKDVFQELSLEGFTDAFAQTLGYGLFLARLNNDTQEPIKLANAKQFIPANFELIRELVSFLDELDKPEYSRVKWLIEEILSIMNNLNLAEIYEGLAFTKRPGALLGNTEEERLVFAKDPYIYFYEDFLKAYDKKMRKARGVYYTPPPVVNFIVRAINDILKTTFGIKDGLADRKRVTILDFATGTGTFLLEVLQQIFDTVPEGLRDDIIRQHVLKNIYGFEYLIAPYTIAHLKLSQFLRDNGFEMQANERLQVYLTNTLEPIAPQANFLLPALTKEVKNAQEIKDTPILVITGNPPYSGHSLNKGAWITQLIETYKYSDIYVGKKILKEKLDEKNPKWLQDDYVKFIRFAQWKMEKVEEGIVGIITNHSFLDNPTFRGMRQSLMKTFNQIYVLDLHGNSTKKEISPSGNEDKNVFDIKQGVSLSFFIKKKGLEQKIYHADFWGTRIDKYRACLENDFHKVEWKELRPHPPFYLLAPQDEAARAIYEQGWKVTKVFKVNVLGFQTHRDNFAVAFDRTDVEQRAKDLIDKTILDTELKEKYAIKDNRDWHLSNARQSLRSLKQWTKLISLCAYRPFEQRWCYFGNEFMDYPRRKLLDHVAFKENLCLGVGRSGNAISDRPWESVTVAEYPMDANIFRRGGVNVFPLYQYQHKDNKGDATDRKNLIDLIQKQERIDNLAPEFRSFIDKKYGHHYKPEAIFGYIYAVLHSLNYRKKYSEFLKIDFPLIPFVDDVQKFEKLSLLGWKLVLAHLLKDIPAGLKVEVTKGSEVIAAKPIYSPQEERLYFNKNQYFAPVTADVWSFHIGGYQVLNKYLKSRKGRQLSLDEKETLINIIKALRFTIDQMTEIDKVFQ